MTEINACCVAELLKIRGNLTLYLYCKCNALVNTTLQQQAIKLFSSI